jgi:cysteine sulfinate desulfinase/cysteine desulfurase-like protein
MEGFRPGTVNVPAIFSFVVAAEIAHDEDIHVKKNYFT